jgi:hypothetical protein
MNNAQPAQPAPTGARMHLVTVFDPARMVRTHQVTGAVNLRAFRGILEGLYTSKQFNPDMNALWDLRRADMSGIMPEDVRELMHVVVNHWGRPGQCHSAILVASPTEFSIARIYECQFGQNAPCQIRVFLDLTLALEWLGVGESLGDATASSQQLDARASG